MELIVIKSKKLTIYAYAMGTVLLWSSGYVFTRVAITHFTPEAVSVFRYLVASIVLLAYVLIRKIRLPKLKDIPWFLLTGASGIGLYVYMFNLGAQSITASASSLIISASPVMIALLARFILRERISLPGWLAVICAFSGVAVITLSGEGFSFNTGVLWTLGATLLISFYNIFQRQLLQRYTPLEVTAYCIFAGTLLLMVFLPSSVPQLQTASAEQILILVYLGVFPASMSYVFWANAMSRAERTSEVANFMFLTPLFTTFMGYYMIGELPTVTAIIGGAIVLVSVLLFNIFKSKSEKSGAAPQHK